MTGSVFVLRRGVLRQGIVPDSLRKRRFELRDNAQSPAESERSGILQTLFDLVFRKITMRLIKQYISRDPLLYARFNAPLKVFNLQVFQRFLGTKGVTLMKVIRVGSRVIMFAVQLARVVKLSAGPDLPSGLDDISMPSDSASDAYDRSHGEVAAIEATEEEQAEIELAEARGVEMPIEPILYF